MQSNLASTWATFWNKISGPLGGLVTLMSFIGIVLLVYGIAKYFLDRRRGGANTGQLMWAIGVGALLVTPQVIIPLLLRLADLLVNAFNEMINV